MSNVAPAEKEYQVSKEDAAWGRLIAGQQGISGSRIAETLGITLQAFLNMGFQPCGVMKIPYQKEFKVYEATLRESLNDHPEVVKARSRKTGAKSGFQAAETRRKKCVGVLSNKRPDIEELYEALVEKLWNPASEKDLLDGSLYLELPAMLWDALQPWDCCEDEAVEIIVDILWAVTKMRTWKVDENTKEQHEPLVLGIWRRDVKIDADIEAYKNVFLAAIRHLKFDDIPKYEGRRRAWEELKDMSQRSWPKDG